MTKEEIWLKAWIAVVSSANSISKESADNWADHCLAGFVKRFNEPIPYSQKEAEELNKKIDAAYNIGHADGYKEGVADAESERLK